MNIPTIPLGKVTDDDGNITPDWNQFFIQLLLYMNTNLSSEGFVAPPLSASQITSLTNADNGTIVYDTTNNQFKGNVNGTFKVFTLV